MAADEHGWWDWLNAAAEWAWHRRYELRGGAAAAMPLSIADWAAAALAEPALADALDRAGVDLSALELSLAHVPGRAVDASAIARGAGEVAWRRGRAGVDAEDVWIHALSYPEIAEAAVLAGIRAQGDGWTTNVWGAIKTGTSGLVRAAWPVVGAPEREAIVVFDHDTVARDFVFHLLVDDAGLSPLAAMRAIRRIERDGEAVVVSGSRAAVDALHAGIAARLVAESSPLRVERRSRRDAP